MTAPTATISDLEGVWVPEFECYAPRYRVEVTKHPEPDLFPYHRYVISVVRGGEANWIKLRAGFSGGTSFDHIADWSTGWPEGIPFEDSHCIRVEAWEIVNQTRTTEDLCVSPEDLVGVPTREGAPWTTVSEDAVICDSSIDVTNPIVPPDPPEVEVDDGQGSSSRDGGCTGAVPGTITWLLGLALLLATRTRRRHQPT